MREWKPVGTGIWVREYDFGGNPINTPVVALGDGNLMAISPGTDVTDADFEALDALGTVVALVAPGAFHHMGLPAWSARYPEAGLYGPASAKAHIAKQHPDLNPLQDLDALRILLPDDCQLEEMPAMKFADIFLAIARDDAITWVTNEVLTNSTEYPSNIIFKWVFKLSGNHPGLNVNTLAMMLVRGKKPEVRAYLEGKIAAAPPTRLVPCHGAVVDDPALGVKIGEVLARRF